MLIRRRPQSLGGVNPTVAFWHWLDRLMYKTHRRHQLHSPRFHIRAIFLGVLILVPGLLWLRSVFQSPTHPLERWAQGACPALPPVSLEELYRTPERFQNRTFWLLGEMGVLKRQCLSSPCLVNHQPCCQPCQAPLILRSGSRFVRLDGWLPRPSGLPWRLLCRGTTCRFSCDPVLLQRAYGVEGRVVLALAPERTSIRPQFKLSHFQVRRLCLVNRQIHTQRMWLRTERLQRTRLHPQNPRSTAKSPTK